MNTILPIVSGYGLVPDAVVNSAEVTEGRPSPWMIFKNCEKMNVFPLYQTVKIGDTVADIQEEKNSGIWIIGLTKSGNEVGLTEAETEIADPIWLKKKLTSPNGSYGMPELTL